ncbi:MAG: hypothetical protein KHZ99_05870 [Clostridium sp.]|uniref:hypothetical protein n=1 Tax=Clostridium sp. TaxID=1506 RepID=UPI0025C57EDE|nr:hypothetical protein [Clostridium sp.]MBS4956557.1 hypothetical protein [Clostridium sp.]
MKNKSANIILTMQERKLIVNSSICDEDLELKDILMSYNKSILKNDLYNIKFSNERVFNNLISHEYREAIIKKSSLEWKHEKPLGVKKNPCELCGCTQSEQKYMIINEINKNKLEVGSSCITKFPSMDSNYKGESIKRYEKWLKYSPDKIERLAIFNNLFGGGKNIYKKWELRYKSYNIEFPNEFDKEFRDLIRSSKNYYKYFINGKIDLEQVKKFRVCINEVEYFFGKVEQFYNKNKMNKYICTKEIGIMLNKNGYCNLLDIIKDSNCIIKKDFSKYINSKEFVNRFNEEIKCEFSKIKLLLHEISDNNIIFTYKYKNFKSIFIELKLSNFVKKYSHIFYEKSELDFKQFINIVKLVNNKDNINEFLGIMELFTRKVGYYFEFNQELYDKQVVNVKKRGLKKSALINISDVIQDYMKILYLDNNNAKELIVNKLEELKWITFKEQEKYNIGNISEVFTKGK